MPTGLVNKYRHFRTSLQRRAFLDCSVIDRFAPKNYVLTVKRSFTLFEANAQKA